MSYHWFLFAVFTCFSQTFDKKPRKPRTIRFNERFWTSHATGGARTRTLSPERDFKSLVSASFRKIQFSFVVSFDFSLRERFFLREREGFAFFDKIILPPFSLHVNHAKLFHLVVLDLRSVRDPGRLPCPDALLRVDVMTGWITVWLVHWWAKLNDTLFLIQIFKE